MRNLKITASVLLGIAVGLLSCAKDDKQELKDEATSYSIFVVDTNRVSTVNHDGSNVKGLTQVAHGNTKSTYISDLSANPERTKIAYLVRKGDFPNYITELRVANFNGTNDQAILSLNQNDIIPGKVEFVSNNKIFYRYTAGSTARMYIINADGTSNTLKPYYAFQDVSNDGRYLVTLNPDFTNPNYSRIQVLDLSGDGGAGSAVFSKVVNASVSSVRMTADGKKAVILYKEGTSVKVQIADVAANTVVEKTVLTGVDAGYTPLFLSLAPDNDSALITIGTISSSKTHIYSITDASVKANFNNVNKDVTNVYAF